MPLTPGYGETPLPDDELAALLPDVVLMLGEPVTRAAVYDLEQGVQQQVAEEFLIAALGGELQPSELLTEYFLKDLHARLYGDVWTWAGKWRTHDGQVQGRGVRRRRVILRGDGLGGQCRRHGLLLFSR
jgi:hypothetical protein